MNFTHTDHLFVISMFYDPNGHWFVNPVYLVKIKTVWFLLHKNVDQT